MRSLTEAERTRIFSGESELEPPAMPIYVDPDLEAVEDYPLGGEAVGWLPGSRRIVLRGDVFENYSDPQLHGLLAHEIGHHRGSHVLMSKIWKCVMAAVVLILFLVGMIGWWLTLDLWVLAALISALVLLVPLTMLSSAWISRRLEVDADRRAIDLLGTSEPIVALREPEANAPRPSGLREWFWELCHPWPHPDDRLEALRDDE